MHVPGSCDEKHFMAYLVGRLNSLENGGRMAIREQGYEQGSRMGQKLFSSVLRRWRKENSWTQERLAEKLNIGASTVRKWENEGQIPQLSLQGEITKLTGMSAEALGFVEVKDETLKKEEEPAEQSEPLVITEEKGTAAGSSSLFPASRRFPRFPLVSGLLAVCLLLILALFLSSLGTRTPTDPRVVGHLSFRSSNQTRAGSNAGINDRIVLTLQHIPLPADGKHYYAWLQPVDAEKPAVPLGLLTLDHGAVSFLYSNEQHVNLLDVASHLLITEQDSASAGLGPSPHVHDQRFVGSIPNGHPLVPSSDRGAQEYSRYGLLDHVRHLLSSDPTLQARGVQGGLVPLLNRQADQVAWLAKSVRDTWESGIPDAVLLHQQMTRLLTLLDGLLPQAGQEITESIIGHVDLHLRGVRASPGASQQLREQAATMLDELVGITRDMHTVHADAEQLQGMNTTQLQSEHALFVLNDLLNAATSAYAGPTGVFSLSLAAETLAGMDIVACTEALCRP